MTLFSALLDCKMSGNCSGRFPRAFSYFNDQPPALLALLIFVRLFYFLAVFEIEFKIFDAPGFVHHTEAAFLAAGRLRKDKERRAV